MPVNGNLLAQFGQPVRPVSAFMDDYARQDAQKQGMQRNALLMMQAEQQMQAQQAQAQEQIAARAQAQQQAAMRDQVLRRLQATRGIDANAASGVTGPRPAAAAAIGQMPQVDPAELLRLGFDQKTIEFLANRGTLGMPEVARTIEGAGPGNMPQTTQFDKFGRPVGAAIPKAVEMKLQDLGGNVQAVNPFALFPGQQFEKTQTKDSIASNATTMRGQNMTDARARDALSQSGAQFNAQLGYDKEKDAKTAAGGANISEGERNAGGYAARMTEATKLLDQFEATGRSTYKTDAIRATPFVGRALQTSVMTADQQRYRQAQEDWVRAKLRKESGAAIGADEMEREITAYFPEPGDRPENVAQKRQAREVANRAMLQSAGRGAQQPQSTQPPQTVNWGDLK